MNVALCSPEFHIRGTKAFRRWTTYFQNLMKQKASLKRAYIKFQTTVFVLAFSIWRDYARSCSYHRRRVKVFIKLHPRRKSTVDVRLIKTIFHLWAREFVPLMAQNRRLISAVFIVQARRSMRVYLEIWVNGWEKKLEKRFSIYRALSMLNSTAFLARLGRNRSASIADSVFESLMRASSPSLGNEVARTYQRIFRLQSSEKVEAAELRCDKLVQSLFTINCGMFLEYANRAIHQKRLFHVWNLVTTTQRRRTLRIRGVKLAIVKRYIRMCDSAENIACAISRKQLRQSLAIWNIVVSGRERQRRFDALHLIAKPALHHWKELYRNRVVRRFRDAPITEESHCSKSVVTISCDIMERDHRLLYLRLLKTRRVKPQAGPVSRRFGPSSENSVDRSTACESLVNGESGADRGGDTGCGSASVFNWNGSLVKALPKSMSQLVERSAVPVNETAFKAVSIKSLWGSIVIDDCSQSTYLGQHARKMILKTAFS